MESLTPVYTAELFLPLHAELISLLRGLSDSDWLRPTIARSWRVRDVAAHLVDGGLRKLSFVRDQHAVSAAPVSSFDDVVALVNDLNASGVSYAQRLSPRLLTELLEVTGRWCAEFVQTMPPHGEARFAVAWAGEERSENWMDIGREYTEHWHHQMQIRDAVGADGLLQRRWLHPLLDLSVRAFPRTYKDVDASPGTAVVFEVEAEGENVWTILRESSAWRVWRGRAEGAAASLRADGDAAWKILFNGLPPEVARRRVTITGDRWLAEPMLTARSVMV